MATVRDRSGNLSGALTSAGVDSSLMRSGSVNTSYSVTPSDSTDLTTGVTEAVLVGAAGDVKVTYSSGLTDTVYLSAGIWHPMDVKRIWSTGTTASSIRAGY